MALGVRGRDFQGVEQRVLWGGGEVSPEWGGTVLKPGKEGEEAGSDNHTFLTPSTGLLSPYFAFTSDGLCTL